MEAKQVIAAFRFIRKELADIPQEDKEDLKAILDYLIFPPDEEEALSCESCLEEVLSDEPYGEIVVLIDRDDPSTW